MSIRDTVTLLRELDPVPGPAPRHAPLRRPAYRVLVAAAAVAVVATGLAASLDGGRSGGFAEAAYAALTATDRVVHLRLRSEFHSPEDEPATAELWTRGGGRELRVVFDGGEHEFVRDADARHAASYVRHRNRLTVLTDPEMWRVREPEELNFAGPEGILRLAEDLPALLDRARDGDPAVRRLPDAELDGRATARLAATATTPIADGTRDDGSPDLRPVTITTIVWFDLDTHLPRRIERFAGGRRETTTEVVLAERLEVNDVTERLLEMPPHPGATQVVG